MRILIVDTDVAFTSKLSERFKQAGVEYTVFVQAAPAIVELKKNPGGVGLVLIARELASAQDGLVMAQTIRRDPKTSDVPYVILSKEWGKSEFAKHQKSEYGANAYYSKKSPLGELESTIEAVTNFKFGSSSAASTSTNTNTNTSSLASIKLEEASSVINSNEKSASGIAIEQPITLFSDDQISNAPLNEEPSKEVPQTTKTTNIKLDGKTEAGVVVTNAPSAAATSMRTSASGAASLAIDLAANAAMDFKIETKVKAGAQGGSQPAGAELEASKTPKAEERPQPEAQTASNASVSLLEISMGTEAIQKVTDDASQMSASSQGPTIAPIELATSIMLSPPGSPVEQAPIAVAQSPTSTGLTGSETARGVSEEEAAKDLPYLFSGPSSLVDGTRSMVMPAPQMSSTPITNRASQSHSDDVETLKKYLTMREQDVSVLTAQLTYAKEELGKSEETIKRLSLQGEDLFHQINDLKNKIEAQAQELEHANRNREGELEQLRGEVKSKIDRIKFLEERLNDSALQYEKLKDRVRLDIRKIRVREKELESKLEILKKDSETLIAARENKILELKRKIDLLEFNYDTLQDKNENEKQNVRKSEEKIERIHKVLKLALGVIDSESEKQSNGDVANVPITNREKIA
jgi:DNA-binding response OmpR family regulator